MDSLEEQKYAEANRIRLVEAIPEKLSKKEDGFLARVHRAKVNPAGKLLMLYSMMDELAAFTARFSPCKKGCSSCCHYKVSISEIEIRHIERVTGRKRKAHVGEHENVHGKPCPFLKNGSCQIYEARPFVCRKHMVLTSSAHFCQPELCNDIELPQIRFSSIDGAFDHVRRESSSFEQFDIRQVFTAESA